MDIIQKSISAIQQTAASLGKRISSNFGWAGQQAQQNIVKPVQQFVQSPQVKAFGSLISPQRGINDISQGIQGISSIPTAFNKYVAPAVKYEVKKTSNILDYQRQQEKQLNLAPTTLNSASTPIGNMLRAAKTDYQPQIDKLLSGNPITNNFVKPFINTVLPSYSPEERNLLNKINTRQPLTPKEGQLAEEMSKQHMLLVGGMTGSVRSVGKPMPNIKGQVEGVGQPKLGEPTSSYSTDPLVPASKKEVANFAKIKVGQKVKANAGVDRVAQIMEKSTDKFASVKAEKNVKKLMDLVYDNTEAGVKMRLETEKNALSGLPEGGVKPGAVKKQNIAQTFTDELIRRSKYVVEKMGVSGKALSQKIDRIYENSEIRAGNYVADIKNALKGVSPERIEQINRYLDGQEVQLNPAELGSANKIRQMLDSVVGEGQKVGLQEVLSDGSIVPLQKRQNYFPQIIDTNKLKQYNQLVVDHLVNTKQFDSETAARAFVDDLVSGESVFNAYNRNKKTLPTGRMGNLEFARTLDLPTIVRRYDTDVLGEYVSRAAHRLETATEFGVNSERLNYLLDSISKEGHNAQSARDIAEAALGLGSDNTVARNMVGQMKQLQSLTKLGLGAITNVGQSVNTATVTGFKNTLGGVMDYFTPAGKEYAERTGVVLSDSLQQFSEESLGRGKLSRITAPGFRAVERFNRVVSANAGRRYAMELADNLRNNPNDTKTANILKRYIGEFNIEKILSNGLTETQMQTAGNRMTNTTQFKVRTWDMPKGFRSPWLSLATQFKSFSYNQTEFMANEVLKPALRGNAAPMVRFVVAGLVLGELLQDTKALLRFRDRPEDLKERLADNLTAIGGFGLAGDLINASSRGPEALLKWIAGPTISDVADLSGGIGLALQGKTKTLSRFAMRQIPMVGPSVANVVSPPQGSYKARTPDLIQEGIGITTSAELPSKLSDDPVLKKEQISRLQSKLNEEKNSILDSQQVSIFGNKLFGMSDQEKSQKIQEINLQKEMLQEEPKISKLLELSEASGPQKIAKDYKLIQYANTVINNADLSQDTKAQIISRLGIDYKRALYYNEASMPTEVKEMMINEKINELRSAGKESEIAQYLATQRMAVAGKMMLSDTILSKLATDGTISYALKDAVKNTSVDSGGNFSAKVKVSKPKKVSMKKIAIRKVKAAKLGSSKLIKAKKIKIPKFKALKVPKIGRVRSV